MFKNFLLIEDKNVEIKFLLADARTYIPDKEIALVVTSPPYYNYIDYGNQCGLENSSSYEEYLSGLREVFEIIYERLLPGGTVCINITNLKSRKKVEKESFLYPIVADLTKIMISIGYVFFDEIIWVKGLANNGALKGKPLFGSYPYPPTPKILDSIFENILIFKKRGKRAVPVEIKEMSKLSKEEWIEYTRGIWFIEPDRKAKHPATFPIEIPYRLIKLYSFVGDWVYDPFAGTGTTLIASYITGRNAIGVEISENFVIEFKQKWNLYAKKLSSFN